MLYATTRSKTESYTAYRVLSQDFAPDGGFFLPFRMPKYDRVQIQKMKDQSFGETVAQVLNLFFSARLTGWDVECCIGKTGAKISAMSHRVLLAELWDNPQGNFSYMVESLYEKLCNDGGDRKVSDWANIAIRIAFLFAIYAQLQNHGFDRFDVAVNSGDFSVPMSVWYAKEMGLPIGTIVCTCNENSAPWDFLHRGELNTALPVVHTSTMELDIACPAGLERLIFGTLGYEETCKYVTCLQNKGIYQIRPDMIHEISDGMFVSVVGKDRVEPVISSVYRSNNRIIDPYTAVSYGGLQDYRAKTGESCPTLLLWERNPLHFAKEVQNATGLTKSEIEKQL